MYKNLNKIFWGIILTLIDINIGMIDILPDFIGYVLIISGLSCLYNETKQKEFNISKVFFIIMLIENIVDIIYSLYTIQDFTIIGSVLITVSQIIQILSFFYMYTGIINILNNIDSEELRGSIILARRNYVCIFLVTTFIMTFALNISIDNLYILRIVIGLVDLCVLIKLAYNIRLVRNYYTETFN